MVAWDLQVRWARWLLAAKSYLVRRVESICSARLPLRHDQGQNALYLVDWPVA